MPGLGHAWIRFYAELNDHLPAERRYRALEAEFSVPASVKAIIEGFGVPHTEVELVLVNGESCDFSRLVQDADRVAVYPMFESLDITPELRVRERVLREPRFVLDVHLGRLRALMLPDVPAAVRRTAGGQAAAFRPALRDIIKADVLEAHRR